MYHDTISFHAKDNLNWHSTLFIRQGLRIGFRIGLGVCRHFEKRKAFGLFALGMKWLVVLCALNHGVDSCKTPLTRHFR